MSIIANFEAAVQEVKRQADSYPTEAERQAFREGVRYINRIAYALLSSIVNGTDSMCPDCLGTKVYSPSPGNILPCPRCAMDGRFPHE